MTAIGKTTLIHYIAENPNLMIEHNQKWKRNLYKVKKDDSDPLKDFKIGDRTNS